jgi:hypothetical protein
MSLHPPALGSGIRIETTPRYEAENSAPHLQRFVFSYEVRIVNELDTAITLRSRHWLIVNADGVEREVRGAGVIGICLSATMVISSTWPFRAFIFMPRKRRAADWFFCASRIPSALQTEGDQTQ